MTWISIRIFDCLLVHTHCSIIAHQSYIIIVVELLSGFLCISAGEYLHDLTSYASLFVQPCLFTWVNLKQVLYCQAREHHKLPDYNLSALLPTGDSFSKSQLHCGMPAQLSTFAPIFRAETKTNYDAQVVASYTSRGLSDSLQFYIPRPSRH